MTTHLECNKTVEYWAWAHMMYRCYNPNYLQYKDWGGRGIRVCRRWQSYVYFLADMGRKPTPKHTLGRIDNNGNYEPNNCRWETVKKQNRNRRSTKLTKEEITEIRKEKRLSHIDLARKFGVSRGHITHIINNDRWCYG